MTRAPLSGVRIVAVEQFGAGPFGSLHLADLGAEIIRLEDPSGAGIVPAIITTGLTKRFRSGQLAVDSLDMLVPRGSVYGFLGPNGSGKTTTIRMLLGLVYPTQGSHSLLGVPMPSGTVQVLPRVGSLV